HIRVRPGARERLAQGRDGRRVQRVALLRPVQRDGGDAIRDVVQQAVVAHVAGCVASSARTTSSGTSPSMRSSAVENVLPCASVISETVPPPSSASCNRKFSAYRLGSSYRSTSPFTIEPKCCFTRSAVTSSASSG